MIEKAFVTKRRSSRLDAAVEADDGAFLLRSVESVGGKVSSATTQGALVTGNAAHWEALERQGYRVKLLPATNMLEVGSHRIDTSIGAAPLPYALELSPEELASWRHHLVQLVAPPTAEWTDKLRVAGVDVVEPVGPYGLFVVASTAEVMALPQSFHFVIWAGPFQPAYRLSHNVVPQPGVTHRLGIGVYPPRDGTAVESAVHDAGGLVVCTSESAAHRGLYHRLVAELSDDGLYALAHHPSVRWIEPAADRPGLDGERECQIVAGNLDGAAAPGTAPLPGYDRWLSEVRVDGTGIVIAICDSGVDSNVDDQNHADLRGRQAAFIDYTAGNVVQDRIGHGTHVAGIAVGNAGSEQIEPGPSSFRWGQGVAPGARFVSMNAIEMTPWPPSDHSQLTRDAVGNGAQIINNSWFDGGPGSGYTSSARRYDQLVRDPDPLSPRLESLAIVFSAGNRGPGAHSITAPKENKNTIIVGNSLGFRPAVGDADDIRGVAQSSSRGPATDGRLLPTVVAPGTDVASALSHFRTSVSAAPIIGTGVADPANQGLVLHRYVYLTGTSMAAPHVAGACALLIQWWQARHGVAPSAAMIKAILVNTAEDCAGGRDGRGGQLEAIPNNDQGWGRVNLNNIFRGSPFTTRGPRLVFDQDAPFTEGGSERVVVVRAHHVERPLRVTLVWTDAPGAVQAGAALVNDLDLEVTEVATGRIFKGNWFAGGFSVTGGSFDNLNNVECVYVPDADGEYEVRVIAAHLRADARPPYAAQPVWQDYALVIDNAEQV